MVEEAAILEINGCKVHWVQQLNYPEFQAETVPVMIFCQSLIADFPALLDLCLTRGTFSPASTCSAPRLVAQQKYDIHRILREAGPGRACYQSCRMRNEEDYTEACRLFTLSADQSGWHGPTTSLVPVSIHSTLRTV